jgi:hypothetical protein
MKLSNEKGSILIVSYIVLYMLVTLSAGLALYSFTELNSARRHYHSTAAFWLAEAGANLFIKNATMLDSNDKQTIPYGTGTIYLTKDDSKPMLRRVTSTGEFAQARRSVQLTYPINIPEVFKNAISTKGDITVKGNKASLIVNDKVRVGGKLNNSSKFSNVLFDDLQEKTDPEMTTLTYPDANEDGRPDEYEDFVKYNQKLVETYRPSEVLYLKGHGTYTITPASQLGGKKIVYVEGGNVNIQFNGAVQKGQNLTIISTGTVTFNQMGDQPPNSQLNIIAWAGYKETSLLASSHKGMIYTHGKATFDNIYDTSITEGGLVANGGVEVGEVWSTKTIRYANTRQNGMFPPGFEGLVAHSTPSVAPQPTSWSEIE